MIDNDTICDATHNERTCKMIETRQISQSPQSTLLFVDIPNVIDGELMDITLVNLPADNQFTFFAFPDNLYRLVGVICHKVNHYNAYVLKFGDWYIVDCSDRSFVTANRKKQQQTATNRTVFCSVCLFWILAFDCLNSSNSGTAFLHL